MIGKLFRRVVFAPRCNLVASRRIIAVVMWFDRVFVPGLAQRWIP